MNRVKAARRFTMRTVRLVILIVVAVASGAAQSADDRPVTRGRVAFTLTDRELIPESLAHDPADGSFYIGSMYKRKIVRRSADGVVSDFIAPGADGIGSVIGIKLDARRRELLANACNLAGRNPPMTPDDETTRGQGGLFRYDLTTGKLLAKYLVGWAAAPRCFNDLVITPDGTAYMTAGPNGIYRVERGATRAELFAEHNDFVNGIAASDDGSTLLIADDSRGVLVMDVATRATKLIAVPSGESLAGIDGLYLRGRTLVAVQNGLPNRPARVIQAELTPTLDTVSCLVVLDRNRPEYDVPTTGVLVDNEIFYIASSQLRRFNPDNTVFPFEKLAESAVIRTPLQSPCGSPN